MIIDEYYFPYEVSLIILVDWHEMHTFLQTTVWKGNF